MTTAVLSKQDQLRTALHQLRSALPELRGTLIATADGLPIAQMMGEGTDATRVAAMAATAVGLGKRINDTLGSGDLTEMSVSGTDGQVYIYAAGRKGVLAVVAPTGMNLGLLHMEARDAAQAVASIL
ncbi:roadblock/LC7 domain-containing protein [Deinococcus maricopensis]|uniref:Roadblock/LC7 family protein n=1 Tax=Deinococcus maricopensis (strain DSM 21211 / LMG 22137 / NRRL B-23946 / LB-34) TaxID=709986 RepID=E8U4E1_DEIML|nr:roadblock/LC7 domain-containing protein [Deinococcus maricopensis]ADV65978.1 Roadblock/LC7 family protein [Deinococcus maricopensis DSM 21211]